MRPLRAAVIALVLSASPAAAQFENVGTLSFPTSGSAEAQQHFLRGVAILHSFGWKQAIAEFKQAQKLQPDFALAYWGETLCYNHPLNAEQDGEDARGRAGAAGARRGRAAGESADARGRRDSSQAVETLWADGPTGAPAASPTCSAMERLHEQFPNDDEVTTFFALSHAERRARARRRHLPLRDEGRGPGDGRGQAQPEPSRRAALHHPRLRRPGARAAGAGRGVSSTPMIVPAVSHAVHMPTHIFIQHGMWNEVAHQNVRAFGIAKDLFQPGDTPGDMSHSGDWGQYGFLQLGDFAGARERIRAFEELLTITKHPRAVGTLALVNARYIIETEEWKVQPIADDASAETILANGMSAVKTGDLATAEKMSAMLARQAAPRCRRRRRARRSRRCAGARRPPANPDAGKGDRGDGDGAGGAHRRGQGPEGSRRSRCSTRR